jgi:hypothetical protein
VLLIAVAPILAVLSWLCFVLTVLMAPVLILAVTASVARCASIRAVTVGARLGAVRSPLILLIWLCLFAVAFVRIADHNNC